MEETTGRVVQVLGGVVDVEFPSEHLPEIYDAVEVPRDDAEPLVLEVEKHLGDNWVRCVSMDSTDGLQRGVAAIATGEPIRVPVGPNTLGRVFNRFKMGFQFFFSNFKGLYYRAIIIIYYGNRIISLSQLVNAWPGFSIIPCKSKGRNAPLDLKGNSAVVVEAGSILYF